MLDALTEFLIPHDWRLLALAMICLGASVVAGVLYLRSRKQNARLVAALNNMSEGLCMFDASTRLILCNERYIEMYGLPAELVKPGVTLRELLEHRIRTDRKSTRLNSSHSRASRMPSSA